MSVSLPSLTPSLQKLGMQPGTGGACVQVPAKHASAVHELPSSHETSQGKLANSHTFSSWMDHHLLPVPVWTMRK
jgi:hypothetical protein